MNQDYHFWFQPNEEHFKLYKAIKHNDLESVKKIVQDNKNIINDTNNLFNPLVFSLILVHNDIAKFLIANGAILSSKSNQLTDLFMDCTFSNNYEMFLYLEKYIKPKPFQKSRNSYLDFISNRTSLELFKHILTFYKSPFDIMVQPYNNILEYALSIKNHAISEYLINLNVFDLSNGSYLSLALEFRLHDISWLLIRKGCNIHSTYGKQAHPLLLAAKNAYLDICTYLLDNGAVISCSYSLFFSYIFESKQDITNIIKLIISRLFNNDYKILSNTKKLISHACLSNNMNNLKFAMEYQQDVNFYDKSTSPPIIVAVASSNLDIVKLLVDIGADLTVKTKSNYTVLHQAVLNSLEVFEFLYSKLPSLINSVANTYMTPFMTAVLNGKIDIAKFILTKTDVFIPKGFKEDLYELAIKSNNIKMMNFIEELGYYQSTKEKSNNYILKAFQYCSIENIYFLYKKIQYTISTNPDIKEVFKSILFNQNDIISYLENVIFPEKCAVYNEYPLLNILIENYQITGAVYLIMNGWNINFVSRPSLKSSLMAVAYDFNASLADLLIENNANVNARDNKGRTVLHYAAVSSCEASLRYFSHLGLDINVRDYKGKAPIHLAAKYGYLSNVQYLVSMNANINLVTSKNRNVLFYAIKSDNQYLVEYLIKHNVDVNQIDNYGKTPLKLAIELGFPHIIDLLKEYNAIC